MKLKVLCEQQWMGMGMAALVAEREQKWIFIWIGKSSIASNWGYLGAKFHVLGTN